MPANFCSGPLIPHLTEIYHAIKHKYPNTFWLWIYIMYLVQQLQKKLFSVPS